MTILTLGVGIAASWGCFPMTPGNGNGTPTPTAGAPTATPVMATPTPGPMGMMLTSPAFADMGMIPLENAGPGIGLNISPELNWMNAPAGTVEFVLICRDLDCPDPAFATDGNAFTHWLVYKIPASATGIPAGVPLCEIQDDTSVDCGLLSGFGVDFVQGINDSVCCIGARVGYDGPYPGQDGIMHRYEFILYALSEPIGDDVPPGINVEQLRGSIDGKILATAKLTGLFENTGAVAPTPTAMPTPTMVP